MSIYNKLKQPFIKSVIVLGYVAFFVIIISQLFAQQWWFLELFTHFSVHTLPLFIIGTVVTRYYQRLFFFICSVMIVVWAIMPLSLPNTVSSQSELQLRVVMANVYVNHKSPQHKLEQLQSYNADIIVLIETGARWQYALKQLSLSYPYFCGKNKDTPFALHIYSRKKLQSCNVNMINEVAYIRAKIALVNNQQSYTIYALHPPPPINAVLAKKRYNYLLTLAKHIEGETGATLVVGDFNTTAYSPLYREFLTQANLISTQRNALPTWALLLNVSTNIIAKNGSDHNGLLIDIGKNAD